jgi:DNA invertase Pin-like site-specific DNA recombinase
MTSTNELAGIWVRVSSGGQDEANQVPDVERHCETHGYTIARRYQLNDKSASKGEQEETLDAMIHDMRDGAVKVLVCWHSDRLERRGAEFVFNLLSKVHDADGRIESVQEPDFGAKSFAGQLTTAVSAAVAHEKSVHLAGQVKLAHDRIRANGAVGPGGLPWGYRAKGLKYEKKLLPTGLCREYAPQIFARCIAGDSCRTIAAWLDVEQVPPKRGNSWHEGSVRKLIHNRVYAGRWQNENRTETLVYCEPVVSANTWDRANAALSNRPHRGPVNENNRPMLANLKCNRCEDSPMFRIRLKSRNGKFYYYYRCTGRGAKRKGCGNMVPFHATEQVIHAVITILTDEPHQTRYWVEGTNWDSEISNVKQDMREAIEAEQFGRMSGLQEQLTELRNREVVKGHWEYEDTGITVGEYFHGLDYAGQREYLKTRDIRVEKAKLDDRPGVRLVLDGIDRGILPLPASAVGGPGELIDRARNAAMQG